jgi:hypothetical protein
MSLAFMGVIEMQFARLQELYNKCVKERSQLLKDLDGMEKVKSSIAKMSVYIDQLERELVFKSREAMTKN